MDLGAPRDASSRRIRGDVSEFAQRIEGIGLRDSDFGGEGGGGSEPEHEDVLGEVEGVEIDRFAVGVAVFAWDNEAFVAVVTLPHDSSALRDVEGAFESPDSPCRDTPAVPASGASAADSEDAQHGR